MPGLHDLTSVGPLAESGAFAAGGADAGGCPNCGDASPGRYCPSCGQRRVLDHLALGGVLGRVVDEAFTINGKLPRTLLALLFRPGHLTREFVAGRIVRYVSPLRLYIAASVGFFLVLSLSGAFDFAVDEVAPSASADAAEETRAAAAGSAAEPAEPTTHWTDEVQINMPNARLQQIMDEKRVRFSRMTPREAIDIVLADFRERVPIAMFVLLPVFALMLKVLYVRRRRYYVEHLTFALHSHAFVFAVFATMILVGHETVRTILMLWVPLYLFLAMRRVYGQGLVRTGAKFGILGLGYVMLLSAVLLGAFMASLLLV